MGSLRIKGVVALANRLRRELSRPIASSRRDELRAELTDSLDQVDRILRRHATRIDALPLPTRRAHRYLATLNLDAVAALTETAAAPKPTVERRFRIPGIQAYWDDTLRRLAAATSNDERYAIYDSIQSTVDQFEADLSARDLAPGDLTPQSQTILGALRFLSDRASFDRYTAAIDRARPLFEAVIQRTRSFVPPARIEFRPLSALYRVRGHRDATRVMLPMAMIVFTAEQFEQLAEAAIASGSKKPILDAAATEAYQSLQAQVEGFSEARDLTAGTHHDLVHSFDRISAEYFDGALPRPRLTWSRTHTYRKLGHYDALRDLVMISRSLDRDEVPTFALDFVVYHELLHKVLGFEGRNGRLHAHTPAFRKRERQFKRFAEAEAVLKRIGASRA